jgi:hypothetical protein
MSADKRLDTSSDPRLYDFMEQSSRNPSRSARGEHAEIPVSIVEIETIYRWAGEQNTPWISLRDQGVGPTRRISGEMLRSICSLAVSAIDRMYQDRETKP